jgi:hypothetical protein
MEMRSSTQDATILACEAVSPTIPWERGRIEDDRIDSRVDLVESLLKCLSEPPGSDESRNRARRYTKPSSGSHREQMRWKVGHTLLSM